MCRPLAIAAALLALAPTAPARAFRLAAGMEIAEAYRRAGAVGEGPEDGSAQGSSGLSSVDPTMSPEVPIPAVPALADLVRRRPVGLRLQIALSMVLLAILGAITAYFGAFAEMES